MLRAAPGALGDSAPARLIRLIVIGTIPAVIAGLLFADYIEEHLRRPIVTVVTLTIGALGFFLVERLGDRTRGEESLGIGDALVFGVGQALALVPGMSRSGTTITVGMLSGVRREAAARFSFLLGIPVVIAAAVKEGVALRHLAVVHARSGQAFVVGILVSGIVGYLSVRFLLRYLATHRSTSSPDVPAWRSRGARRGWLHARGCRALLRPPQTNAAPAPLLHHRLLRHGAAGHQRGGAGVDFRRRRRRDGAALRAAARPQCAGPRAADDACCWCCSRACWPPTSSAAACCGGPSTI